MSGNKAQMVGIDVLLLIMATAILVVFLGSVSGEDILNIEEMRYNSVYSRNVLLNLINYKTTENITLGEIFGVLLCVKHYNRSMGVADKTLNDELKHVMDFYKKRNNYILWAVLDENDSYSPSISFYDKQQTVCLKDVSLATREIPLPLECGDYEVVKISLGMWPEWVNPLEAC